MMKKRMPAVLLTLCLMLPLCALADTFAATGTFPLPDIAHLWRVLPAKEGGVYAIGSDLGPQEEALNVCLGLDRDGTQLWRIEMEYDEKKMQRFMGCIELPDGSVALLREMLADFETEEIPVSEIVRVKNGTITGVDAVGGGSAWYMWISLESTEDGYMVIYTKGDSHGNEADGTPLYQTTVEHYTPDGMLLWDCSFTDVHLDLGSPAKVPGGYLLVGNRRKGFGSTQHHIGVVLLMSDTGAVQWMHTFDGNATDYSSTCGDPIVHDDGTFSVLVRNEPAIFEEGFTLERRRFSLAGKPIEGLLPIDEAHIAYRNLTPFAYGYTGMTYDEEGRKPIKLHILDEHFAEVATHDIIYDPEILNAEGWVDAEDPQCLRLLMDIMTVGVYERNYVIFEAGTLE